MLPTINLARPACLKPDETTSLYSVAGNGILVHRYTPDTAWTLLALCASSSQSCAILSTNHYVQARRYLPGGMSTVSTAPMVEWPRCSTNQLTFHFFPGHQEKLQE
eukprot:721927-Pyramimonas_sp.AAC.1